MTESKISGDSLAPPTASLDRPEAKSKKTKPGPKRSIRGDRLAADLSSMQPSNVGGLGYWLGALPSLPMGAVHIAGVTFAQIMEVLDSGPDGETLRFPHYGVFRTLSDELVQRIAVSLPRLLVRFNGPVDMIQPPIEPLDPHTQNVGYEPPRGIRRGSIVRIPSDDEIVALKRSHRYRPFVARQYDEPLAAHVYMVRAQGRGEKLPAPVIETGITLE